MSKEINLAVGKKVAQVRKNAGYNQEQLSSGIGLTRTSVCNIEMGVQSLSLENLLKICAVLKCSVLDILPPVPKATVKKKEKVIRVKELLSKTLDVNFKW